MAASLNNLGSVYKSKGEYDKAIELYNKSLSIRKMVLGNQHPDVINNFLFLL